MSIHKFDIFIVDFSGVRQSSIFCQGTENAFVVGVNLPFAKMASMSAFLLTRGIVGLDKKARNASLDSTWPTKFFRSASTFSKLPAAPAAWKVRLRMSRERRTTVLVLGPLLPQQMCVLPML